MRSVFGLIVLATLPLWAGESALGVNQLLQTITDGIESGYRDSDLARRIDHMSLTQSLGEPDINWLATVGAGPKTMKALRKLQDRSATLHGSRTVSFTPQPTVTEADNILQAARNFAYRYTTTLVDFSCTVTIKPYTRESFETRPFADTSIVTAEPSEWREGKAISQEVSYYQGHEYTSGTKSGKDPAQGVSPGSSWSDGEFAQLLKITFAPSSQAHFSWDHWEDRDGAKLAVFSYSIAAAHSQLVIDTQIARTGVWQNTALTAAYRGFVYVDTQSGAIFRLIANTAEIPSDYAVKRGNTVLDYGPTAIAGKTYFLLTSAVTYISTRQYDSLFRKTFNNYRKFEVNSKLVSATNN